MMRMNQSPIHDSDRTHFRARECHPSGNRGRRVGELGVKGVKDHHRLVEVVLVKHAVVGG